LGANIDLANTDGMDPKNVAIGYRLLYLGAEPAEPLGEALPPPATPPHLKKVVRRAHEEKDREKKVIYALHAKL
jgi:hypothetical protein